MNKNINIVDKDNFKIEANLVFSFSINDKKYIVLDYFAPLFNDESKYNNLNIFGISKVEENTIYVADIDENEWKKIKDFLQEKIFDNI